MLKFQIDTGESLNITDSQITNLLTEAYVDARYTSQERALELFQPQRVRSRGQLLCARPISQTDTGQSSEIESLAGMVILVLHDSSARKLAEVDETEMQLLAVATAFRRCGLGRSLVSAIIGEADRLGYRKMILWTQHTMMAAQKLYESSGFVRNPQRDPTFDDKQFLFYEKMW